MLILWLDYLGKYAYNFGPTLLILKMSSVLMKACWAILIWPLSCMVVWLALVDSQCNRNCSLTDDSNVLVNICLFDREKVYHFPMCCQQCHWVNFSNESFGNSFDWMNSSQYPYGQYNCILNQDNNDVRRRALVIPPLSRRK